MSDLLTEDINKLADIDDDFAIMEEYVKGREAELISEIRKLIQKLVFKED